ncbi:hypothetical protein GE061_007042 [Apolygus lucorum]|uniref:Endonuclease/exonuclease/phosphatase domain-containing protein n=1 Tax=Apolygus lucorum TaxID=248454 RepID=A0A8S9WS50_APOLU|nr:hypothetical protein GE061_007042 [Apolygus lucorum]
MVAESTSLPRLGPPINSLVHLLVSPTLTASDCLQDYKTTTAPTLYGLLQLDVGLRDLVAAKITLTEGNRREHLIAASAYLPGDSPLGPPPPEVAHLVEKCKDENVQLLIGMDANAHHLAWGSTNTNNRDSALI